MAKAYIDIVKYMVEAKFEISGLVDKPDIIGAVFGQTEGLLGGSLDLRELQKNGKIGRIEISTSSSNSRTFGKLFLPSSLGRVETCILAAAIESVDRVGPFETRFLIEKVEDTRDEKRKKIINRAKELVKLMLTKEIPDSREISDMVEADVKSSVIGTYGSENLPAGPDIDKSDDVMIVEGRADVITLLKNDISNCIAVGGASGTIPKSIIDLCNAKEATVFVDGDRGGEMIVKNLLSVAEVDYVAKAPDGKEVEELTRKEIIKALRSKTPTDQYLQHNKGNGRYDRRQRQFQRDRHHGPEHQQQHDDRRQREEMPSPSRISSNLREQFVSRAGEQAAARHADLESVDDSRNEIQTIGESGFPNKAMKSSLDELRNTLRGRLYDKSGTLIKEVPVRELMQSIQDSSNAHSIVFDGIITQRLIEIAYQRGVREVYGVRSGQITREHSDMEVFTLE